MVEDIIKAVNHQYIYVSYKDFDEMKIKCKAKLLACSSHSENKFKAFFNCKDLNEIQFIELLKICNESNTVFLGFIKPKKEKTINIYNEKIYSGDCLKFYEDTLILQDIPFDCFIESSGNLYIIGKVKGKINLIYQDCKISASLYENAFIRIFDTNYQNTTNFACTTYYYLDKQLMKEEKEWEYVLASPLAKVE